MMLPDRLTSLPVVLDRVSVFVEGLVQRCILYDVSSWSSHEHGILIVVTDLEAVHGDERGRRDVLFLCILL